MPLPASDTKRYDCFAFARSARNCQTKKSAGERVDTIVQFIGRGLGGIAVLVVLGTKPKQTERYKMIIRFFRFRADQIASNLQLDELVEGYVGVKRRYNAVAIPKPV